MDTADSTKHPAEPPLAWAALVCWLAAWFLPVIEDYPGWAAFRSAITGPFRDPFPVGGEEAVPQILSALTNIVFAVLFTVWWRDRLTRPVLFLKIAIACLVLDCYWLVQMLRAGEASGLLSGYYVWLLAFLLLNVVGTLRVLRARKSRLQ